MHREKIKTFSQLQAPMGAWHLSFLPFAAIKMIPGSFSSDRVSWNATARGSDYDPKVCNLGCNLPHACCSLRNSQYFALVIFHTVRTVCCCVVFIKVHSHSRPVCACKKNSKICSLFLERIRSVRLNFVSKCQVFCHKNI